MARNGRKTARSAFPSDSCLTEWAKGGTVRVTAVPRPTAGVITSPDGRRYVWLAPDGLADADVYTAERPPRKLAGAERERISDLITGGSKTDSAELAVASEDEENLIAWVRTELTADKPTNGGAENTD